MRLPVRWIRLLFRELKRRGVLQTAGIYLVGGWLVVQVAVAVFPVLLVPDWALRALVIAVLLGFPVSVVMAWAYDLTPRGLRRSDPGDGPEGDGPPRAEVPGWVRLLLVLTVILGSGAVGWWSWTGWLQPRSAATAAPEERGGELDPARVAVLYFDDLSRDQDLRYLADGLTDAVYHELAQLPALWVVSRNGVKPFRDTALFPDSIARRLGVGTLVEGSIDRTGEGLEARVQLVDGNTGRALMSRRIHARGTRPLVLRDSIVSEAARALGQRLGRELQLRSLRDDTDSPEAWELFLRAKQGLEDATALREGGADPEQIQRALQETDRLLAAAEEADDEWLRPVVMRGDVARRAAKLALNRTESDRDLLQVGLSHADRALRREPDYARALALRGRILAELSWTASGPEADTLERAAEDELQRALALDETLVEAWVDLAQLRRRSGTFAGARVAADRAMEADPFLINAERDILLAQAMVWLDLGEQERARRWLETGRRRYPRELAFVAGELVRLAGGPAAVLPPAAADSAWTLLRIIERAVGGEVWREGRLQVAAVLALTGHADSARRVTERIGPADPDRAWPRYYEALVRLHLGEEGRALELLGEYLTLLPQRRDYIAREWWWTPLRDDEGFQRLVAGE